MEKQVVSTLIDAAIYCGMAFSTCGLAVAIRFWVEGTRPMYEGSAVTPFHQSTPQRIFYLLMGCGPFVWAIMLLYLVWRIVKGAWALVFYRFPAFLISQLSEAEKGEGAE